jgi:hypothetical protein
MDGQQMSPIHIVKGGDIKIEDNIQGDQNFDDQSPSQYDDDEEAEPQYRMHSPERLNRQSNRMELQYKKPDKTKKQNQ